MPDAKRVPLLGLDPTVVDYARWPRLDAGKVGADLDADVRSVIETARRRGIAVRKAIRLTLEGTALPISPQRRSPQVA